MITRKQADAIAVQMMEGGSYPIRKAYLEKFGAGRIAECYWNDGIFGLGFEYGVLSAIKFIFGDLEIDYNELFGQKR